MYFKTIASPLLGLLASCGSPRANEASSPRSICGQDDLQQINAYDGTLGQPRAFARQHQFAVGAMAASTTTNEDKYCTGTLVGPDLFLTAGHCVEAATVGHYVAMNYELDADGATPLPQDYYRVESVVEASEPFDFALVRLEGKPGLKYGWANARTHVPAVGETLTIIQHPVGEAKQIAVGHLARSDGGRLFYADLDTQPGSSGAGILDARGRLVGVHTLGLCTGQGGENSGTSLAAVTDAPILAALERVELPFAEGSQIEIEFGLRALVGDVRKGVVALGRPGQATAVWTVADERDGSFRLLHRKGQRTWFLDARARLRDLGEANDFTSKWRILREPSGSYVLRSVAPGNGDRWLAAHPASRAVGLDPVATEWEIVVKK